MRKTLPTRRAAVPAEGRRCPRYRRLYRYQLARDELARRFGARPVNVAAHFVNHLHALVDARTKPTWETVLSADIAMDRSRAAIKLGEYVEQAWQLTV
ncbi:hypothetical protein [Micromonospora arida]|uniref:hypothetical protein n=1 Tax=Micromonospora arida TaxID=2203715 RepID=UPI0033B32A7F